MSSEQPGSIGEPRRSIDRADPLETAPPAFSLEEVEGISKRVFGRDGKAEPVDSERDQNFRLRSPDGESFLLKISNPADDLAAIEMQTAAMLHIKRQAPDLPVMQPLRAIDGALIEEVEAGDGHKNLVRLFTFLPGRMLASAELNHQAIRAFGAMVARMGLALRGFFHPAAGYKILWDLKNTSELRPMLNAVSEPSRRGIAERVLDRFDAGVATRLPGLRAQPIHNDLTLDNVLLDDRHRPSGIVDFGDLTHTALVCDLAIALVSLMWGRPDPLETAEAAVAGYCSVQSIDEGEAELLADLVAARLAALVLIAAWRVRRYPENSDYITANVDLAWALLERFHDRGFDAVKERVRSACTESEVRGAGMSRPSKKDLLQRRERLLGPALSPLSYREPLYLVRGRGSKMFDDKGIAYIDAYNNVPVVGHCHPQVVAAIAEQSRALNTNTRYLHESVVELAERLVATMPDGLDTVVFVNSGSEANDIAWRLAAAYTGGAGGIVTSSAYHGVTTATIALSPEEWVDGEYPAHIERISPPGGGEQSAREYGDQISAAVAKLNERGLRPAACYLDPLFTSDGILTPPPAHLAEVRRRLAAAGCLLVADEVQCGFGRVGSHLWSFQASGVTPDFVTLGKPMGNGHPVAAVITRRDIAERFAKKTDMFSTFGGNPVACRAALAVLDVIEREELLARTIDVGDRLRGGLLGLMEHHAVIADVRGAGLMIGVELSQARDARKPAPDLADAVINQMKDRGVLIGITGPHSNVLKIRPPLVLNHDEADAVVEALDDSLSELAPD